MTKLQWDPSLANHHKPALIIANSHDGSDSATMLNGPLFLSRPPLDTANGIYPDAFRRLSIWNKRTDRQPVK